MKGRAHAYPQGDLPFDRHVPSLEAIRRMTINEAISVDVRLELPSVGGAA